MPTNTGVAPICNAKAEPPEFFTKPPRLPHFAVPNERQPRSLVTAIQQLQQALAAITSPVPVNNTPPIGGGFAGGPQGAVGGATSPGQQNQPGQWTEKSRETQNVKVVNPDDDSQFVIVKEIKTLTMENSTTGESIVLRFSTT